MDQDQEVDELATQPIDDSYVALEPPSPSTIVHEWGRLYPLVATLKSYGWKENIIAVGRSKDCYVQVTNDQLSEENFCALSKVHFEIRRTQTKFSGAWTVKTQIYDKSSQGTFINGCRMGHSSKSKENVQALNNNDIIGLPTRTRGHYPAYVFVDMFAPVPNNIPNNVRKCYQVTRRLGCGAFGEVFLVFNKETFKPFAMKRMIKDKFTNDYKANSRHNKIINELEILNSFKIEHPHVINLVDVKEFRDENFLFLEYMEGKDLASRISEHFRLDECVAKLYFYQIASGVHYLHENNVIHRDLKPANILLKSSNMDTLLKLSDFGLSKMILTPLTRMKTMCGSKMYTAPEVLLSGGRHSYTSKVDIWSMGVLLYVCILGFEPFSSEPHLIEHHIKNALYSMPLESWGKISIFAKSLIERMLTRQPTARISINEVLEDTWLQDKQMHAKLNEIYSYHGVSASLLPREIL